MLIGGMSKEIGVNPGVWKYNEHDNFWTKYRDQIKEPRVNHGTCVVANEWIYVIGGDDPTLIGTTAQCEKRSKLLPHSKCRKF